MAEARKLGFRRVIMPALNAERLLPAERGGVEIVAVRTLEAALVAVRLWRFVPATRDGVPVTSGKSEGLR